MRTRRVVATSLLASSLVVTACSTDDGTLDLADDGPPAAAAPSEEPQVEPETDGSEVPPDDAGDAGGEDPEPLYPPLPPGETDPDLSVPIEHQELVLEVHEQLYHLTQTAITSARFDPDELAEVLHGDLLDDTIAAFEERRDAGIVEVAPDSHVEYVRIVGGGNGPVIVHECRIAGPATIDIDEAGNTVSDQERTEPVPLLFEFTFEIIDIIDGELDYRAVSNQLLDPDETCHA